MTMARSLALSRDIVGVTVGPIAHDIDARWLMAYAAALGETEEQINKRFSIQPGGQLVVEVDFGSIDVQTNSNSEVTVDVLRRIGRIISN